MKIIRAGEIQTIEIMNKTISGFTIPFYAVHTTANTAFTGTILNWQNVSIKVLLYRGNRQIVIWNGMLREWAAFSSYGLNQWRAFATSQTAALNTLVAAASGVKQQAVLNIQLNLPGVINLKGTDKLTCQVNFPGSGAVAATVDTAASFFELDEMEGVGIEEAIPTMQCVFLQANQSSESWTLGDGVCDIFFFNYDKLSYLTANQPLQGLNLSSDKWERNDQVYEMFTKAQSGIVQPSGWESFNSFCLYKGIYLNKVKLQLQENSANITASQNAVVWSNMLFEMQNYDRAVKMRNKHANINLAQYK